MIRSPDLLCLVAKNKKRPALQGVFVSVRDTSHVGSIGSAAAVSLASLLLRRGRYLFGELA